MDPQREDEVTLQSPVIQKYFHLRNGKSFSLSACSLKLELEYQFSWQSCSSSVQLNSCWYLDCGLQSDYCFAKYFVKFFKFRSWNNLSFKTPSRHGRLFSLNMGAFYIICGLINDHIRMYNFYLNSDKWHFMDQTK